MKNYLPGLTMLVVALSCSHAFSDGHRGGGLIGNGSPLNFTNLLLGVQGNAPASWNTFDFGQILSLVSPKDEDENEELVLSIKSSDLEPVDTPNALYDLLVEQDSHKEWHETSFHGHRGFENIEGKYHTIVLLTSKMQKPLIISYQDGEGRFHQELQTILSSLKIY